ncbi:MAG: DUF2442 domain-containing protein [Snowella sp.]|nr:DUF2442 domain-containing protein [Snowella sp.]
MFLHVIYARYVDHYKLEIQFNNGRTGIVNLADSLTGRIFEPLQDLVLFQQFKIDPELGTIRWSNGADIAPEYLYFLAFRYSSELQEQFERWGYLPDKIAN